MFTLLQKLASRPAAGESAAARDERLRAAFAAAPVALAVAGLDGRWLLFNDTAAILLGYTREELRRVTLNEITHADDLERENALLRKMSRGEVARYQLEKRVADKQGKYRELLVTASMLRGPGGNRDSIVYTFEPPGLKIETGRSAEGLSNQILESLADTAVIRTDPRGTILGWNRGAQAMFRYSREEIIGRNRRVLYRAGAPELDHYEGDDWRVARDGRELWVHVTVTPFAPEGELRGFVEVIHAGGPPAVLGETMVAQLREELERERSANVTLERVVEKLKTRLQAEKQEVAALREKLARLETAETPTPWTPLELPALSVVESIANTRRSGLLLFVAGGRQKSIHFEEGRIASCASNDPDHTLGERLVRRGAITEAQRNKAVEMASATNVAMGRAVLILRALSEDEIVRELRAKIDDELAELGSWTGGRWAFVDRLPPRVKPVRLAVPLEETRAFEQPEFVASRNGTRYHRTSCTAMLRVRGGERMPVVSALAGAERGLSACRICIA